LKYGTALCGMQRRFCRIPQETATQRIPVA